MILTGRRISAQEALIMGLANRVVSADELDHALELLLGELKGKSRAVLRVALKGLREISLNNFSQALQRSEELYLNELLKTEDVEEGVQAFLEKRKPRWATAETFRPIDPQSLELEPIERSPRPSLAPDCPSVYHDLVLISF